MLVDDNNLFRHLSDGSQMARRVRRHRTHYRTLRSMQTFAFREPRLILRQEDRLLVSDPKALQYIYQTTGYRFPKTRGRTNMSRLLFGPGIIAVEGWYILHAPSGAIDLSGRRGA